MIIYRLTNKQTGKIYIGQSTRSLRQRMLDHAMSAKRSDTYLARAINKYGMDSFKAEVIDTAEDISNLNQKEEYWIKLSTSLNRSVGYNMLPGGLNHKHLEETKRIISLKNKTKVHTKEHNLKVSLARKGYRPTPEALRNQSLAHIGIRQTDESNKKRSVAMLGRKKSEETKAKMRHPKSEEHRRNISIARRLREQNISTVIR